MRIAALYDIHGNLPALDAVLAEVRRARVDAVVIGGDVLPGPMPRQALGAIAALEVPTHCLAGNGERAVIAHLSGRPLPPVPEKAREVIIWNAGQLGEDDRTSIGAWPTTLRFHLPALGDVLFCHATPRNDTEIFTRLTPEEPLRAVFSGASASLVVCGHTHMAFDRMVGRTRVVNAGSVGMPFGEPGAYWLLLGDGVEFRHTMYDLERAAATIRATSYPQAQEFAEGNILHPPPEAEMLVQFSRAEVR